MKKILLTLAAMLYASIGMAASWPIYTTTNTVLSTNFPVYMPGKLRPADVEVINDTISNLTYYLVGYTNSQAGAFSSISFISNKVDNVSNDVASLKTAYGTTSNNVTSLNAAYLNTSGNVVSLQSAYATTSNNIDGLQAAYLTTSGNVISLQSAYNTSSNNLTSLQSAYLSTSGSVTSLNAAYLTTSGNVSSLQTAYNNTSGNVVSLQAAYLNTSNIVNSQGGAINTVSNWGNHALEGYVKATTNNTFSAGTTQTFANVIGGRSAWGSGFSTSNINENANGAYQRGFSQPDATPMTIGGSDGAGQHIQIDQYSVVSIGDGAHGALQLGRAGSGRIIMGDNAVGAVQMGDVQNGAATNNGVGSLQLLDVQGTSPAIMDGNASIGLGGAKVTHNKAIVAGDGQVSQGAETITAGGGMYSTNSPQIANWLQNYQSVTNLIATISPPSSQTNQVRISYATNAGTAAVSSDFIAWTNGGFAGVVSTSSVSTLTNAPTAGATNFVVAIVPADGSTTNYSHVVLGSVVTNGGTASLSFLSATNISGSTSTVHTIYAGHVHAQDSLGLCLSGSGGSTSLIIGVGGGQASMFMDGVSVAGMLTASASGLTNWPSYVLTNGGSAYDGQGVTNLPLNSGFVPSEVLARSRLSFSNATRRLNLEVVTAPVRYTTKSEYWWSVSTNISAQITDDEGLHYIYFDKDSGQITSSTQAWGFDGRAHIAQIYWDKVNQSCSYLGDERHVNDITETEHYEHHFLEGAKWASGGALIYNIASGTPSTSGSNTVVAIQTSTMWDDDHTNTTAGLGNQTAVTYTNSGASFMAFYATGLVASVNWRTNQLTNWPFMLSPDGTRPVYNSLTAGVWGTNAVTEDNYFISWIVQVPTFQNGTNSGFALVPDSRQFASLTGAQARTYLNIYENRSVNIVSEQKPLYRLIFLYNAIGGGSYNALVKSTKLVEVEDLRVGNQNPVSGVGGSAIDPSVYMRIDGSTPMYGTLNMNSNAISNVSEITLRTGNLKRTYTNSVVLTFTNTSTLNFAVGGLPWNDYSARGYVFCNATNGLVSSALLQPYSIRLWRCPTRRGDCLQYSAGVNQTLSPLTNSVTTLTNAIAVNDTLFGVNDASGLYTGKYVNVMASTTNEWRQIMGLTGTAIYVSSPFLYAHASGDGVSSVDSFNGTFEDISYSNSLWGNITFPTALNISNLTVTVISK